MQVMSITSLWKRFFVLNSKSIYTSSRYVSTINYSTPSQRHGRALPKRSIPKRKRTIKPELKDGESNVLYSTDDDDYMDDNIHTTNMEQEPNENDEEEEEPLKIKSDDILNKVLEIRKPIKATGEYLYGPNAIYSALKSNKRPFFHRLYVSEINDIKHTTQSISKRKQRYNEIISLCELRDIPIEYCTKKELSYFVGKNMHQGFVLDCDQITFPNIIDNPLISDPKIGKNENTSSIWIAFDHLFNEENVGAVLRSALFFNIAGCIYSTQYCAPLSPIVANTSSGSLDCMDIRLCSTSINEYLMELKDIGWNVIGLDVINYDSNGNDNDIVDEYKDIRIELHEFKSSSDTPMIIVIGNESKGLSDNVRSACTELVHIDGNKNALEYNIDSLNVASACSVALYHITQNRFI